MNDVRQLWALLFIVLAGSSALTLIGSWLVLWRYRRSVVRAMRTSGFAVAQQPSDALPIGPAVVDLASPVATTAVSGDVGSEHAKRLFRRAVGAPLTDLACIAAGGLAYALVLASAYLLAIPAARTPLRFALTLWVDIWPLVIAAALIGPRFVRWAALGLALYAIPFVIGTIALLAVPDAPADSVEAALLALRDTVTPRTMARFWLVFAALPTAVLLLFLNPRLRAVSPLLLTFTTIALIVLMAASAAIFTALDLVAQLDGATPGGWAGWLVLLGAIVLGVVAAIASAWLVLGWIRKAYLAKTISDRSLSIDALWLFFASYFAIQFVLEGKAWLLSGVLAFAAYRLVLGAARSRLRLREATLAPRGLVFLRVFSLGPKSSALFDTLAKHWRRVGSLQLITGPDLAQSTAQPHHVLDFVSGQLASHFIGDAHTLAARLDRVDRVADRDGWYRINNFFCRADTWQAVLARMVQQGDVVLMDLRSFSASNSGCVHELRHLAEFVPLGRCVFVVDATTDLVYFRSVLREGLAHAGPTSPNRGVTADAVEVHSWATGAKGWRSLLDRLSRAA